MKSQLSCILFALVAACGGGKKVDSKVDVDTPVPQQVAEDAPKPVETKPVEIAKPAPLPTTYAECLEQGKLLVSKGDHVKARELLEAAAKLDRKKSEPYIELARSYIVTNEKANAIKSARKAVKLAPESSQAYNTLGRAELLRHSYDDAIEAFRQATELNPDNVWAWNNLGFVHLTLKHYEEAVVALSEATSRKGTEGFMWNNLGLAYEQLDQLDDARDAFDAGAKLGSLEAKASRKRLEGVDTIAVAPAAKPAADDTVKEPTDTIEPSPEDYEKDELKTGEPDSEDDEPTPADETKTQ